MDQQTKEKSLENLTKAENILVVVAPATGYDGLASGLALHLSLAKLGKNAIVLAQSPTVGVAARLYGVDKIGKVTGAQNPVIVVNDAPQTVDKVSYFLDGDQLKVIIHPLLGSKGISRDQISLEYITTLPNLIFAIGFENRQSLEKEIPHEQKISSDTWLISISRELLQQKFAQHEFVNPQSASISEVTARVLQDLALPLDEDIAYNLYTAISDSTEHFSPAKTTAQTFEIAAWLVKFGAGRASLASESERVSLVSGQGRSKVDQNLPPRITASQPLASNPLDFFDQTAPIDQIESLPETRSQDSGSKNWLKPPKIYKGSKSFNGENKG